MTRRLLMFMAVFFAVQQGLLAAPGDLTRSSVLETDVLYLRVAAVGKTLPVEIQSAITALTTTNPISGTVLDLRFADGSDFDVPKAVADLLAAKKLPLAVLVNGKTTGAAVALAKNLRDAHTGLVFGAATGEFKPDVVVSVEATDEKDLLENPYGTLATNRFYLTGGSTNEFLPMVDHTSEADLVRARIKDGEEDESLRSARPTTPPAPFIRDPALARGIDFIRGWAVLRLSHS